jgi:hypothetical protein
MKIMVSVAMLLALCISSVNVWAQTVSVAQITGTVKDPSGALVRGAEVKVTQTDTSYTRSAVSDDEGAYTLPSLPVGRYQLEVTMAGFKKYVQTGIVLQVNSNPSIHVILALGEVNQTVQVNANAAMVETYTTSVGQVIDHRRMEELPLNGRQVTQLILLSGAAVQSPVGAGVIAGRNYPTSIAVSVAGGTANGTNFLLDGAFHLDTNTNVSLPLPFPDAVQEFKVETSTLPARYGFHPGGVVNAITKSGTNKFHGDVFEFVRNDVFNATSPFAATRADGKRQTDGLKRNQFGGTLGGPIVADKLFFFAGYQGTILKTAPATNLAFVPTAAMLNGDFTAIASAPCNAGQAVTLRAPFVNNRVDPSQFSQPALNLLKFVPISNDPCGSLLYGIRNNSTEHQGEGRVDYKRSETDSIFVRYFIANFGHPPQFDGKNILLSNGTGEGLAERVQSIAIADTHTFSSRFLGSFRANFARVKVTRLQSPNVPTYKDIGSNISEGFTGPGKGFLLMDMTNGFAIPSTLTGYFASNSFQLTQDFDLIRGSHQISFGANWIRLQHNGLGPVIMDGRFGFNGSRVGGNRIGLADFMLGLPNSFQQGNGQTVYERAHELGLYIQDSWRVTPKLSINAGLRWEPFFPSQSTLGMVSHFEQSWFLENLKSQVFTNAPPGIIYKGDPGFPGSSNTFEKKLQLAPRLGLVIDPKGDGRQTIRAAYGIFYDYPEMWQYSHFPLNPPWGSSITVLNPFSFADPWHGYTGGNPFPTPVPLPANVSFPLFGSYTNLPLHVHPMYMQQWNLSYQRQFGQNWLVSVSYIGNKTTHLWLGTDINHAIYIAGSSTTGNTNQRRQLYLLNPTQGQYFADILQIDDGANANYNAMLGSVEKRFSGGLTWNSNFTWSKCIDDGEVNADITNTYPDPGTRGLNRGLCGLDHRFIFHSSLLAESRGIGSGVVRKVTAGWELSAILTAQSGDALTITSGADFALTGLPGQRPMQIADPKLDNPTLNLWFNTSAFTANPPGLWAGIGRGTLRGPRFFDLDLGLLRRFEFSEQRRIEFRVEAFNATNRLQAGDPSTALNSKTFGKITSAGDPRILQFSLKYVF